MCDYKKRLPDKNGVFFCDRVLVFASHIRYNDRKLFQRERRKTVMKKLYLQQETPANERNP